MKQSKDIPDWRTYERFVANLMSDEASANLTVIPNAKLTGAISGTERQIDVLIDARLQEDVSRRIIVDAKFRRRKIDIKEVESFEGMMRDCRAQYGILVCPNGYSPAALQRAQDYISIRLVTLEELEHYNPAAWELCAGQCAELRKRPDKVGWVLFDHYFGIGIGSRISLMAVSKCDLCHDFHVWCWDCGQKFALIGNEAEYKCSCDRFWLTSVEDEGEDEYGNKLEAVLLIVVNITPPDWKVIDRRPLN